MRRDLLFLRVYEFETVTPFLWCKAPLARLPQLREKIPIDGSTTGRLPRFSPTAACRVTCERPPVLIDVDGSNWTFGNLVGCVCVSACLGRAGHVAARLSNLDTNKADTGQEGKINERSGQPLCPGLAEHCRV